MPIEIEDDDKNQRLEWLRTLVAKPFPEVDPEPALFGDSLYVGSKYHAADVAQLLGMGVTALLNCAPSGIRNLPRDAYENNKISYISTNVKRDDADYPLLHNKDGTPSEHLKTALALYDKVMESGGKVLFNCVAGVNRSAALAVAVLLLRGQSLETTLERCSQNRPFILENIGFQQQLVELESLVNSNRVDSVCCKAKSLASSENATSAGASKNAEPNPDTVSKNEQIYLDKNSKIEPLNLDNNSKDEQPNLDGDSTNNQENLEGDSKQEQTNLDGGSEHEQPNLNTESNDNRFVSSCQGGNGNQEALNNKEGGTVKSRNPEDHVVCEHRGGGSVHSDDKADPHMVHMELFVPGLYRIFDVSVPAESTVAQVKDACVDCASRYLLSEASVRVGKSWLVYHGDSGTSGADSDLVLEEEAIERCLQVSVLKHAFGLHMVSKSISEEPLVCWHERDLFELVIFSVVELSADTEQPPMHKPFTFRHRERSGAPGSLLWNNAIDTHLRAWDFGSGQNFRSPQPAVFTFAANPRNRRDFMDISASGHSECQKFVSPGDGVFLGMGANAIVHRLELAPACRSTGRIDISQTPRTTSSRPPSAKLKNTALSRQSTLELVVPQDWDAAVKRSFSLHKMLHSLENKSEAGMAKRLRMAGALNSHGRLLYFFGLGIALSSNCDSREEYKFEVALLSRYQEEFSTYTLKRFLEDYIMDLHNGGLPTVRLIKLQKLQEEFSLIKVKVLLVSLLNGFRDLTLMGVQAFDFNHLDNVLISRDYKHARLIDIDGESKGSIQIPSEYIEGKTSPGEDHSLHMPALDVDLSTLLPVVVSQLICGKGRGKQFVTNTISSIKRARSDEDAKAIIQKVIRENFFPELPEELPDCDHYEKTRKHCLKAVEWFHALLMKRRPWHQWTNDIYDAMRCIDHLPIS